MFRRLLHRTGSLRQYRRTYANLISVRVPKQQAIKQIVHVQRRAFILSTVLLPPVVFGGLVITLWTWKCFMMVVFQDKIIYMPGLPPNARRETIEEYKNQCGGVIWKEERIRSGDGTQISLCVASVETGPDPIETVYIVYFQGNASSIPSRLPLLSSVLRMLEKGGSDDLPIRYKVVCCSYRGYWTSKGRASEKGILLDAKATLYWIKDTHLSSTIAKEGHGFRVVVWGVSIGAGVAANLVTRPHIIQKFFIGTLIMETPFLSIRSMLETLYPQKWLPYRYLWPFLWNHLDTYQALGELTGKNKRIRILILQAEKDELVPSSHPEHLERRCQDIGLDVRRKIIPGALHTEVITRPKGRLAVIDAIQSLRR